MINLDNENKALNLMKAIELKAGKPVQEVLGIDLYNIYFEFLNSRQTLIQLNEILKGLSHD